MDDRLKDLLDAQDGVCSTADADGVGLDNVAIEHLVRSGLLHRCRRGAFIEKTRWEAALPEERHLLRTKAILRCRPADVASHHSALLLHGIRTFGVDLAVVDVGAKVNAVRLRSGLRSHPRPKTWFVLDIWPLVSVADACVQVAAASGSVAGIVSMDHALHEKRCTTMELEQSAELLPTPLARKRASAALKAVDPLSESVGETRTRLLLKGLGYAVRSQVWIDTAVGPSRVDLLLDEMVVIEFDGAIKYEGAEGRDALMREKRRESALVDLGFEVVRVTWRDLEDPRSLHARIIAARNRALARRVGSAGRPA